MTAKSELLGAFVFLLSSSEKEASPTITLLATLGAGKKRTCHDKDEVCTIITSDPPLTTTVLTSLGGFKVVQLDRCRVIYGADGDGIGLAVVTSLTYRSRVAIELLEEMYSCLTSSVSTEVLSANQEAISKKIQNKLENVYTKYCDPSSVDKLTALEGKVERAKLQMEDNISKSLENTVKAEALAEKSEQALSEAAVFHKNSEKLRKHMAWKNLKMTLLLSAVIGIILLSLLLPLIPK